MRAPRTRLRAGRAGATFVAATLATTLVLVSGGTALADGPPVPSVQLLGTDETSDLYRQVFGLVDSAWDIPRTIDPVYLDGTEIKPPDVQPWMGKVYGIVRDPVGNAMAGVTLIVDLIPSGGVPDGQEMVTELGRAVTDELGRYGIEVPTTETLLKEAEYLNGNVNLWISAIKYESAERGGGIWQGGAAVYSALAENGGGVGGMAIAPVNVGVLTLGSEASGYGASLPGTPSDDPYAEDGSYRGDGSPSYGVLDETTGEVVADAPVAGRPYVETPAILSSTLDTTPPVHPTYPAFPTSPMPTPEGNEDPAGGDARCRRSANQNRWINDSRTVVAKFQPVGEVHGWWGTVTNYEYSARANSVVGARAKYEGKSWEVSGGTTVTNDAKFTIKLGDLKDFAANPVEAEFNHFHVKETWCPYGYDGDRVIAAHRERIYVAEWTGGLRYGSKKLGGDGHEEFKRARSEGRAMTMFQYAEASKDSGKSYKYTAGVTAFGVGIDIESSHDTNHKMMLKTTARLQDWHAWGNKGVPASAANNAIYVSG